MIKPIAVILAGLIALSGCTSTTTPATAPATTKASVATSTSQAATGDIAAAATATAKERASLSADLAKLKGCDYTKKAADPTAQTATDCAMNIALATVDAGVLYSLLQVEALKSGVPALVLETRDAAKVLMQKGSTAGLCVSSGTKCDDGAAVQTAIETLGTKLAAWPS